MMTKVVPLAATWQIPTHSRAMRKRGDRELSEKVKVGAGWIL
jgi:hypothetical protein